MDRIEHISNKIKQLASLSDNIMTAGKILVWLAKVVVSLIFMVIVSVRETTALKPSRETFSKGVQVL